MVDSGRHQPREPRHAYDGKVRLLLGFEPWRLVLTLKGMDVSSSGVSCVLPRDSSPLNDDEAEALIVPGDPYELQLEHDLPHLAAPVLPARLVRHRQSTRGTELAFHFEETGPDILGLVHELSSR